MSSTEVISADEAAILAASHEDESLNPVRDQQIRDEVGPGIFITDWEMLYDLMGIQG